MSAAANAEHTVAGGDELVYHVDNQFIHDAAEIINDVVVYSTVVVVISTAVDNNNSGNNTLAVDFVDNKIYITDERFTTN